MSLRLNVNSVIKSSTECETSRDCSLSKQKIRKKGLKEGSGEEDSYKNPEIMLLLILDVFCYAFSFFTFEMNRNMVLAGIPDTCVNRMLRIRTLWLTDSLVNV